MQLAIQGELGSNSHMAALSMLNRLAPEEEATVLCCSFSTEVFEKVTSGAVFGAVLPIENSLHGSVAEHYDLLLREPVTIRAESLLPISHSVIAVPGVSLRAVSRVLSHPVALAQCRRWFTAHPEIEPVPFYDTAGAVKHIMAANSLHTAALAPELAATQYGAEILLRGVEDHPANYTRFYLLTAVDVFDRELGTVNKLSVAFSVGHRPGTLVTVLDIFRAHGLNLTRIESRPVPGSPWQYIFFVDLVFDAPSQIDAMLPLLRPHCATIKELGRYPAA